MPNDPAWSQSGADTDRHRSGRHWPRRTPARAWMEREAADLMVMKAASRYDHGEDCGAEANAAKYHVERYLRECYIPRIAPVSTQMVLNVIAEKVLGLPKSY